MCRIKRRARGLTLAGTIVYVAIAIVFLTLLYGLFIPVLSLASTAIAKAGSQTPAAAALFQLESDLRVGSGKAITVGFPPTSPASALGSAAETTVIAIPSAVKFNTGSDYHGQYYYDPSTGLPLWRSYVVWVLVPNGDGTSTLYRTTVLLANPYAGAAQAIDMGVLAPIVNNAASGRVMARAVTSLQLASVTLPPVCSGCVQQVPKPEIEIALGSREVDQRGQFSVATFQTQIFARNS